LSFIMYSNNVDLSREKTSRNFEKIGYKNQRQSRLYCFFFGQNFSLHHCFYFVVSQKNVNEKLLALGKHFVGYVVNKKGYIFATV
jgi:hypothetical protein